MDDSFAEVYDLEKKSAALLAKGDDGWLEINREILDIQEYWSADDMKNYASYKEQRRQEERTKGHWKAVSGAMKQSRREYEALVKQVTRTDLAKSDSDKPKKKSPKSNKAVAQKTAKQKPDKKKAAGNKQVAQNRVVRKGNEGR